MPLNRLRELVRDLMKIGVATCAPDTVVADIARTMLSKDLDAIIVLNPEDGNAIGVVSQFDLLQA